MKKGNLAYTIPFAGRYDKYRIEFYMSSSNGVKQLEGDINTFTIDCGDGDQRFDFYRGSSGYINLIARDNEIIYYLIPKSYTDIYVRLIIPQTGELVWQGYVSAEGFDMPLMPPPYTISLPILSMLSVLDRMEYSALKRTATFKEVLRHIFYDISFGNVDYIGFPEGTDLSVSFHDGFYYPGKEEQGEAPRLAPSCGVVLRDIAKSLNCQVCEVGNTVYFVRSGVVNMDVYPNTFGSMFQRTLSFTASRSGESSFIQKWQAPKSFVEITADGEVPILAEKKDISYQWTKYIPGTLGDPASHWGWGYGIEVTSMMPYNIWNIPNGIEVSFKLEIDDSLFGESSWREMQESDGATVIISLYGPLEGSKTITYKNSDPITIETTVNPYEHDRTFTLRVELWDIANYGGVRHTRLSKLKLKGASFEDPEQEKSALSYHIWETLENKTGEKVTVECGLLPSSGQRSINSINGTTFYNELLSDLKNWYRYSQYYLRMVTLFERGKLPIPNIYANLSTLYGLGGFNIVTAYSVDFWEGSLEVCYQRIESLFKIKLQNGSTTFRFLPYTKVEVYVQIMGAELLKTVSEFHAKGLTMYDPSSPEESYFEISENKAHLWFPDHANTLTGDIFISDSGTVLDKLTWKAEREMFFVYTDDHKYEITITSKGYSEIPLICSINNINYTDYREVLSLGYSIEGDGPVYIKDNGQAFLKLQAYDYEDNNVYYWHIEKEGETLGPDFKVIIELPD